MTRAAGLALSLQGSTVWAGNHGKQWQVIKYSITLEEETWINIQDINKFQQINNILFYLCAFIYIFKCLSILKLNGYIFSLFGYMVLI